MTEQYTPTTEEVREDFAFPWSPEQIGDRPARVAAFDRWLAAHDAQVLRDAADRVIGIHGGTSRTSEYAPDYADWLREEADRIAGGTSHE